MPRSRYWTLVLFGPRLTGNEIEMIGAGIGFTFAARADDVARAVWSLQRNEPPRCTRFFWLGSEDQSASEPFDSWVRPRLQFADVLDRIGAFPASKRTQKELLVGALPPARPAGTSALD